MEDEIDNVAQAVTDESLLLLVQVLIDLMTPDPLLVAKITGGMLALLIMGFATGVMVKILRRA